METMESQGSRKRQKSSSELDAFKTCCACTVRDFNELTLFYIGKGQRKTETGFI